MVASGLRYRPSACVLKLLFESWNRSEEHTSELQSLRHLVCRLLLEKKKERPAGLQCRGGGAAPCGFTRARGVAPSALGDRGAGSALMRGSTNVPCPFFFFLKNGAPPEIPPFPLPPALPF